MAINNLWKEHDGKGFAAIHSEYAVRASKDEDGNEITTTYATKNDIPTVMTGATSQAAGTSGLVPAPTVEEKDKFLKGDGTWTAPPEVNLANYYYDEHGNGLSAKRTNGARPYGSTSLVGGGGNMNTYDLSATFFIDWGGSARHFFTVNTADSGASRIGFGTNSDHSSAMRYLLPTPVANKYAKTNADGKIVWGDVPSLPSPSINDSLLLGQSDGSQTWTALERDTFGSITDDNGDEIQDEEGNSIGDENVVDLWTSFNGTGFGAERAVADVNGNSLELTLNDGNVSAIGGKTIVPDSSAINAILRNALTIVKLDKLPLYTYVTIGDRDYRTVQIGDSVWLAENLDYVFDGLVLNNPTPSTTVMHANYYENSDRNKERGLLYNWKAVEYIMANIDTILPGWHVPSGSEWISLKNTEGGVNALKSTTGWNETNGDGTYQFNAYPSGMRKNDGNWTGLGRFANYWTSDENGNDMVIALIDMDNEGGQSSCGYSEYVSIRLVRDAGSTASSTFGGRTYETVTIGDQTWLAENLDFKFENCVIRPEYYDTESPAACYYDNDEDTYGYNGNRYGLLYNGYALKYLIEHKDALIPGWHIPTDYEWSVLMWEGAEQDMTKLKSTTGWDSGDGTDASGFSAYPYGEMDANGYFSGNGRYAEFWTSDLQGNEGRHAWITLGDELSGRVYTNHDGDQYYIRLVKD